MKMKWVGSKSGAIFSRKLMKMKILNNSNNDNDNDDDDSNTK